MANGAARREIEAVFRLGAIGGVPDGQLLERFARGAEAEVAFAALVARHGPMVLRTCRAVLRDEHDAEDAFQATFLVLARRGRSLGVGDALGPWLLGVARRVALRARADAGRRRDRERRAAAWKGEAVAAPAGDDLAAELLAEVDRLPGRYRAPVVLCSLEGRTLAEAAETLRWPVGTVSGRLTRARTLLRDRLTRRGLAPATLLLAAESADASAPPASLIATTARAAAGLAAGRPLRAVATGTVATLARGVLQTMTLQPLGLAAALLATVGLAATGALLANQEPAPAATPPTAAPAPDEPNPPGPDLARVLQDARREVDAAEDDPARVWALIAIAKAQALVSDRAAALATFRAAEEAAEPLDTSKKYYALRSIARAAREVDVRDPIPTSLRKAAEIAEGAERSMNTVQMLRWIADEQLMADDREAARATTARMQEATESIKDENEWFFAMMDLVFVRASLGEFDAAFRLADTAKSRYTRGTLLGQIAEAVYSLPSRDRAMGHEPTPEELQARKQAADRVIAIVEDFEYAEQKPWGAVAMALASLGDFDRAIEFARRYGEAPARTPGQVDLTARPYYLGVIALEQHEAGRAEEAKATIREALDLIERDRPQLDSRLGQITAFQADIGDPAGALVTIEKARLRERPGVLMEIAEAQAGDEAAAQATFRRAIEDARALLEEGPPEPPPGPQASGAVGATDIAGKPVPPQPDREAAWRSGILEQLAEIRARAGDIPGALETAQSIRLEDRRAGALSAIARAQAARGDVAGVREWLATLDDPRQRLAALRGMAEGIVDRATAEKERPRSGG